MRKVSVTENIMKIEKSIEESKNEIMRLQGCLMVFKGFMDEGLETIELPSGKPETEAQPETKVQPTVLVERDETPHMVQPETKPQPETKKVRSESHHDHNHIDRVPNLGSDTPTGINEEYVIETC